MCSLFNLAAFFIHNNSRDKVILLISLLNSCSCHFFFFFCQSLWETLYEENTFCLYSDWSVASYFLPVTGGFMRRDLRRGLCVILRYQRLILYIGPCIQLIEMCEPVWRLLGVMERKAFRSNQLWNTNRNLYSIHTKTTGSARFDRSHLNQGGTNVKKLRHLNLQKGTELGKKNLLSRRLLVLTMHPKHSVIFRMSKVI